MQVVILAAGYGTRLYPLTKNIPKALLPVSNKAVLEYILQKLKNIKFKKIIIVTNNKYYSKFLDWLSNYTPAWPIELISDGTKTEAEKLGAIGDLKLALKREKIKDDILVLTSDMIFSFSLNKFISTINSKKDQNWMLLYKLKNKKNASQYGVALLGPDNKIIKFQEKPSLPFSPFVAFGIYYLAQNKLGLVDKFLKAEHKNDAPGEYFQWLLKKDSVYGYVQRSGLWIDIGNIKQYHNADKILKKVSKKYLRDL